VKEDCLTKTFPVPKPTGHILDPLNTGVDCLLAHHSSPPDLKQKIAHTIDANTLAAITTHAKKVSHGVLNDPILSFAPFGLFNSLLFGVGNERLTANDRPLFSRPFVALTQALSAVPAQADAMIAKNCLLFLFFSHSSVFLGVLRVFARATLSRVLSPATRSK
jgi:hypothetical protein